MKWLQADKKKRPSDASTNETPSQLLLQSVKDAHEEIVVLRGKLAEYKWLEDALRERTHELNERMKELECLHAVSSSLTNHRLPLEQVLDAVVKDMPHGWQYPQATCVRIIIDGREFVSPNFRRTSPGQRASIRIDNRTVGEIEVCLLPEAAQGQQLTILNEERTLLNIIALWLGETLRHRAPQRFD